VTIRGRAHVVGHHVDTDVIIPARYLVTVEPAELAKHAFEDLDPTLRDRIGQGDILIAGENFGQGSSREHAPLAIKACGIGCIVAASFGRLFYRNALNIGLLVVECPEAISHAVAGTEATVDLGSSRLTVGGRHFPIPCSC